MITSADRPLPAGALATQHDRTTALALAAAGLLFAAYPALRPYADETTLAGAAAMASTAWVLAHTAGMVAFATAALGITRLLRPATPDGGAASTTSRAGRTAGSAAWLGALLVLPYYGAETFGLQAIAARAVADGDVALLGVVEAVRYGPVAITTFGLGLLAVAAAGVALARTLQTASAPGRIGALLVGVCLTLYLPQFFAPPVLRIAHGAVLGLGLILLATHAARTGRALST